MVSALYTGPRSPYRKMGVDCWDVRRDARRFPGGNAVVTHPPCRGWSRLRGQARPGAGEKDLSFHALATVRRWGGVLEHPAESSFWKVADLPRPGAAADAWGGYTLSVLQRWWGHRARKATFLSIVGVAPAALPDVPYRLLGAETPVENMGRPERERTPPDFARWLVEVARRAHPPVTRESPPY